MEVVDYVSSDVTFAAGAACLGRHGRLVTLAGAGQQARLDMAHLRVGEREIVGSRYVSRAVIMECLKFAASGEIWPM